MFDFQNLKVYQKSIILNRELRAIINKRTDKNIRYQLQRAGSSIVLNIAEGCGKFSRRDKKNFYTIARGSTYECVAILDLLLDEKVITQKEYDDNILLLTEISKMLLGLMRSMSR